MSAQRLAGPDRGATAAAPLGRLAGQRLGRLQHLAPAGPADPVGAPDAAGSPQRRGGQPGHRARPSPAMPPPILSCRRSRDSRIRSRSCRRCPGGR